MAVPRIVIVGGGFGGLAVAKSLRKTPAEVVVIDRSNHHLFQPLLYQVAISVLAPGQIGSPLRGLLRKQKNTTVLMGEVTGVNIERKCVLVSNADQTAVQFSYDYLVLATGASTSYFGHNEFERFAPGLKSLAEAVAIRNRVVQAFEQAEAEQDPRLHQELLTFVLVGAGATGVEMAGAIADLVRKTVKSEFRRIDPASARIMLVDRSPRVLKSFSPDLSRVAQRRLEKLGVEIRLASSVDEVDATGIVVAGERIPSRTVIWTAGVASSPAGKWLQVGTDRAGRVRVQSDLSVPNYPDVFVIGDTASLDQDGKPLPAVAQVAMQQGRYVGKLIDGRVTSRKAAPKPFRYFDKGSMAVVGKDFAVLEVGKLHISGFFAWAVWAAVHLEFLGRSNLRLLVFLQWVWTYITGQPGSRLLVDHCRAQCGQGVSQASGSSVSAG